MTQMLLLGAGASKAAGVPAAYEMTTRMVDVFEAKPLFRQSAPVLKFVAGGLVFHASKRGENPLKPSVNIEDLFNAVQLLANRHSLEAAPFVGSWDDMVDTLDQYRGGGQFDQAIHRMVSDHLARSIDRLPTSEGNIDRAFEAAMTRLYESLKQGRPLSFTYNDKLGRQIREYLRAAVSGWRSALSSGPPRIRAASVAMQQTLDQREAGGNGAVFSRTNALMIAALKDLVWISEDVKVESLGPILNLLTSQRRLVVASLNYDNAVELLCKSQGVRCSTGIESWQHGRPFDCLGDGVHLLKLHGSIDWKRKHTAIDKQSPRMPVVVVEQVGAEEFPKTEFEPAVIFGQRNKLTADGPFLELLRAFQSELAKTDVLTVVGYSFRDDHINTNIAQWLNDHNGVLRIVNGESFQLRGNDFLDRLQLFRNHARDRIQLVPKYANEGLIDLFGRYPGTFGSTSETVSSAVDALSSMVDNAIDAEAETGADAEGTPRLESD